MADKKKTTRKQVDWELGDKLILAGQLTVRQIGEKLGCSGAAVSKRRKLKNLDRDLTGQVRKAARAKLVNNEVNKDNLLTDSEVIEGAAIIQAGVVVSHRGRIARRLAFIEKLTLRLEGLTDGDEELEDIIKELRSKDEKVAAGAIRKVSSMPSIVKCLTALVKAEESLIKMERQAFNIEEGDDLDDNPKSGKWVVEAVEAKS